MERVGRSLLGVSYHPDLFGCVICGCITHVFDDPMLHHEDIAVGERFDTKGNTNNNNFYNARRSRGRGRLLRGCDELYIGTMVVTVCVGKQMADRREGCRDRVKLQIVVFFWQGNGLGLSVSCQNTR